MAVNERTPPSPQQPQRRQRPRPPKALPPTNASKEFFLFSSELVPYEPPIENDCAHVSSRHSQDEGAYGNGYESGRSSKGERSRRRLENGNDASSGCESLSVASREEELVAIPKLVSVTVQKSHPNEPVGLRLQQRQVEGRPRRRSRETITASPPESGDDRSDLPQRIQLEPLQRLSTASNAMSAVGNAIANSTVTISSIAPTSPFLSCTPSLREGDEILTINGHRVRDPKRAAEMIKAVGTDGRSNNLTVLASQGERMKGSVYHMIRVPALDRNEHYGQRNLGIEFEVTNDVLVRIKSMDPSGPFLKTCLHVGDVVLSMDGTVVRTAGEARRSLFMSCRQSQSNGEGEGNPSGGGNSKVLALLTYSFWEERNRVIQKELIEGSSRNWEVEWPGRSHDSESGNKRESMDENDVVTLRIANTTVTFDLVFDRDGTCSCPEPLAALKHFPEQAQGQQKHRSPSDEESCSDSKSMFSHISRSEARSALELLFHKHIQAVIDALNYRTWKQIRLLAQALSANGDGRAPEFLPLPDPSTAATLKSPKPMKPLVKKPHPSHRAKVDENGKREKESQHERVSEKLKKKVGRDKDQEQRIRRANTNPAMSSSDDRSTEEEKSRPNRMGKFSKSRRRVTPLKSNENQQNVEIKGLWKISRKSSIVPDEAVRMSERTNYSDMSEISDCDDSDSSDSSESTSSTDSSDSDSSSESDSSDSSSEVQADRNSKSSRRMRQRLPNNPPVTSSELVVYSPSQDQPKPPQTKNREKPKPKPPKRQLIKHQMGSSRRLNIRNGSVNELYKVYPKVIGTGAFGTVRSCKHRHTNERLAVKSILKKGNSKNAILLKNEISLMQRVNHKNVVGVKDVIEDKDYIHIVMEECKGGDLFDKIIEDGVQLEEARVSEIIGSLLDAVEHLHELNIVHRDLKAEHIMLSKDDINSEVKIIDFGLAIRHKPDAGDPPMTAFAGSPFTVAPEVISRKYGRECDLWSVGVISYFLLTRLMPFNSRDDNEIFKKINSGQYSYPKWAQTGISKEAKDFISRLLKVDPKERLTAKQALDHPWITAHQRRNSNRGLEPAEEGAVETTKSHQHHHNKPRHMQNNCITTAA